MPIAVTPFPILLCSALTHSSALSFPQSWSMPTSYWYFSGPLQFTLGSPLPLSQLFMLFVYSSSDFLPHPPASHKDLPHLESNHDLLRVPDLLIAKTLTLNTQEKKRQQETGNIISWNENKTNSPAQGRWFIPTLPFPQGRWISNSPNIATVVWQWITRSRSYLEIQSVFPCQQLILVSSF